MNAAEKSNHKCTVTWSVRMTAAERKEADYAAKRFKCGSQRAYRFQAEVGAHLLRLIDYRLEELIVAEAIRIAKEKV